MTSENQQVQKSEIIEELHTQNYPHQPETEPFKSTEPEKSQFSKFKFKVIAVIGLFLIMLVIFVALSIVAQKNSNQQTPPVSLETQSPSPSPSESSPESKVRAEISKYKGFVDTINSNSDKLAPPNVDLSIPLK